MWKVQVGTLTGAGLLLVFGHVSVGRLSDTHNFGAISDGLMLDLVSETEGDAMPSWREKRLLTADHGGSLRHLWANGGDLEVRVGFLGRKHLEDFLGNFVVAVQVGASFGFVSKSKGDMMHRNEFGESTHQQEWNDRRRVGEKVSEEPLQIV